MIKDRTGKTINGNRMKWNNNNNKGIISPLPIAYFTDKKCLILIISNYLNLTRSEKIS